MRAAVFKAPGQALVIEECPDPTPAEGEVVVRVHRCGICGSDLHITEGHGYTVPEGTVLGHEFAGEVVAVGKNVDRFKVGDRAAAMPIFGCGHCASCLAGEAKWCNQIRYVFGGYAEYALMSAHTAVQLPNSLSSADGALVEPLAVALHGVAMAGLTPGAHVLIQGAGPIGLAALFWAKRLGAGRVDMIEGSDVRANIARQMGASSVRPPTVASSNSSDISEHLGVRESQPEFVFECVGRPGLLDQSVSFVRRRGTIVSLGFCITPDSITPAFANSKELKLLFPVLYTTREFEVCIDALDGGAVEPRTMVTKTVGFSDLPDMFESLRRSPKDCKVLIDPLADAQSS